MRVPSTMRAAPVCAASQLFRRCGGVMPLCRHTTASGPYSGSKRSRKRASSWGVRLISGTITSTWVGLLPSGVAVSSTWRVARKYTSVLPLPVAPYSSTGAWALCSAASAWRCSSLRSWPSLAVSAWVVLAWGAAVGLALARRLSRRASCSLLSSRSCGGSAAMATSPRLRW